MHAKPGFDPNLPHSKYVRNLRRILINYLDMTSIAEIQDKKEREVLKKYQSTEQPQDTAPLQHEESTAARVLQRTYRGHRARRQMRGLSLDPSTRWTEVRKSCISMRFNLITQR